MVSLVIVTEEGRCVEVGVLGNEGFAGAPSAVGLRRSISREVVQIAGDGFRVDRTVLQNVLRSTPQLQALLSRYAVLQEMQVAQTAAGQPFHRAERRAGNFRAFTAWRCNSGFMQAGIGYGPSRKRLFRPGQKTVGQSLGDQKACRNTGRGRAPTGLPQLMIVG